MSLSRRCLAGAILAANLALSPAWADVKAGVDAWQKGNFTAAIAEWRPMAEQGDADAQFNMGQAYKLGRGVTADLKAAQTWYEKAALQDHEEAQANLGLIMFQNGEREGAMVWLRKAADRGDPRAEFVLATALFNGDNIEKDLPRAYALMSHAAAQGLLAATTSLSEMETVMPESDRQQGIRLARELLRKEAERTAMASQTSPAAGSVPTPRDTAPKPRATRSTHLQAIAGNDRAPASSAKPAPGPVSTASAPQKPSTPKAEALASAAPVKSPVKPAASPSLTSAQGRWRVQFGAYGSLDIARGQWSLLSKKITALASLKPSYEPFGALTRLRVNSLNDRPSAEKLCSAAKAAGQACFAIAP
jgi:TPR repeat protein